MRYDAHLGAILMVMVTFVATAVHAEPRICVRATLDEPFALPDGSQHPAGLLRICLDRELVPGAGLHTIVAGQEVTRYLSRRTLVESEERASKLAFLRNRSGVLTLRGYTLAHDGRVDAYWIRGFHERKAETVWLAAARVP